MRRSSCFLLFLAVACNSPTSPELSPQNQLTKGWDSQAEQAPVVDPHAPVPAEVEPQQPSPQATTAETKGPELKETPSILARDTESKPVRHRARQGRKARANRPESSARKPRARQQTAEPSREVATVSQPKPRPPLESRAAKPVEPQQPREAITRQPSEPAVTLAGSTLPADSMGKGALAEEKSGSAPTPAAAAEGQPAPTEPVVAQPAITPEETGAAVTAAREVEGTSDESGAAEEPVPDSQEAPSVTETAPPVPRALRQLRWRPGLRVRGGLRVAARKAEMKVQTAAPLAHEAPMLGGSGVVEIYPAALNGIGAWYEGFGAKLGGRYASAQTRADDGSQRIVRSDVWSADVGATYRWVPWNSSVAPEFNADAGWYWYRFPLSDAGFPGVRYNGLYVGASVLFPVAGPVTAALSGRVVPQVKTGGQLRRLGSLNSGRVFELAAESRASLDALFVCLRGTFSDMRASFNGATDLPATTAQYRDVALRERLLGLEFLAGVEL